MMFVVCQRKNSKKNSKKKKKNLIKEHFVGLFKGLTMADDLAELMRKMMEVSSGQGRSDYGVVTLANRFDYSKWNNHQRGASTSPVFRVKDRFLGYTSIISRTHEIFESSLIYYNDRPDLMKTRWSKGPIPRP